jgi:hypothetical protein
VRFIPTRKPKNPTHADRCCTIGFSIIPATFGFILWRRDIKVKDMKNKIEKEMAIAMNTAVVAVGAESISPGASPGSTEKSVSSWGIQRLDEMSKACMDDWPYRIEVRHSKLCN